MKDGFFEDLADSNLPEDDFTPDMGSKYLLDGYDFDMNYGEGVLDGARLPETRGLSQLPEGFIRPEDGEDERLDLNEDMFVVANENGMDLSEVIADNSFPRLDWLDPLPLQTDRDRLPRNPVDLMIPELSKALGDGFSSTGLELVPNVDPDLPRDFDDGPESGLPGQDVRVEKVARIRKVAQQAMRLSTFGAPLENVQSYTRHELGEDAPGVLAAIQEDHGLAGNVFLRESAFPGIHNGKWDDQILKKARKARYILASPGSKMEAFDNYLGKQVVTQVPWEEALNHYRTVLQGRLASDLSPKEALRRAFLSRAKKSSPPSRLRPSRARSVPKVSREEAWRFLEAQQAPGKVVLDKESRLRTAALSRLAKWVSNGMLTEEDRFQLLEQNYSPRELLKRASEVVISKQKASSYEGSGVGLLKSEEVSSEEAWENLKASHDARQAELEEAQRQKVLVHLSTMVRRGLLSSGEARKIASFKDRSPQDLLRLASVVARTPRNHPIPPSETREYRGPRLARHTGPGKKAQRVPTEQERILKVAKENGLPAVEIRRLLHVARKHMNEGFAGDSLDQLLRMKFSQPLRTASTELLGELRSKHEGLAGHLYVDAETYASARGVTGCEKGANRHRTTPIKFLLEMGRCQTCVHRNAHDTCTLYNKELVSEPPVADPLSYQREMIRLSDASDAERTASYFSPAYNAFEFNLQHEQEISLTEGPSTKELGDILFGGMELE